MARRWTKKETQALLEGVGVFGIAWFRRRGGSPFDWPNAPENRSKDAVYAKAARVYGGGGLSRGAYSLRRAAETTGYSATQLRRAMKALAQKWKRTSSDGSFLIYDEQLNELTDWLRSDYWSKAHRLYSCLWCGTADRRHYSIGLCNTCYHRYYRRLLRAGIPTSVRELLLFVRRLKRRYDDEFLESAEDNLVRGRAIPVVLIPLIEGM